MLPKAAGTRSQQTAARTSASLHFVLHAGEPDLELSKTSLHSVQPPGMPELERSLYIELYSCKPELELSSLIEVVATAAAAEADAYTSNGMTSPNVHDLDVHARKESQVSIDVHALDVHARKESQVSSDVHALDVIARKESQVSSDVHALDVHARKESQVSSGARLSPP